MPSARRRSTDAPARTRAGLRAFLPAICAAFALQAAEEETILGRLGHPLFGDLDAMLERRVIRALVPPSRTDYWIDRGRQTGSQYELLVEFEKELNRRYQKGSKHVRVHVGFIPTPPDRLIQALLSGEGDLAAGILTITPERLER